MDKTSNSENNTDNDNKNNCYIRNISLTLIIVVVIVSSSRIIIFSIIITGYTLYAQACLVKITIFTLNILIHSISRSDQNCYL